MRTKFTEKYMALKDEETQTLNRILKMMPRKEYSFDEDGGFSVDCYINDSPHRCNVAKVVYPVSSDGGIFVESEYVELSEIGSLDMGFGEISSIIENLPEPCLTALDGMEFAADKWLADD